MRPIRRVRRLGFAVGRGFGAGRRPPSFPRGGFRWRRKRIACPARERRLRVREQALPIRRTIDERHGEFWSRDGIANPNSSLWAFVARATLLYTPHIVFQ